MVFENYMKKTFEEVEQNIKSIENNLEIKEMVECNLKAKE